MAEGGNRDAGSDLPLVAVVNTSEEIAEMLSLVLHYEGIRTVTAFSTDFKRGRQDIEAFLRNYDPPVIIYDIAIPYAENWAYFERVRDSAAARGRTFIVTTTNQRALEGFVGEVPVHEILGKPYDMDQLVSAVRRAMEQPD